MPFSRAGLQCNGGCSATAPRGSGGGGERWWTPSSINATAQGSDDQFTLLLHQHAAPSAPGGLAGSGSERPRRRTSLLRV